MSKTLAAHTFGGRFDVLKDIEVEAEKALGETILAAVEQPAKIAPVSAWPTSGTRK